MWLMGSAAETYSKYALWTQPKTSAAPVFPKGIAPWIDGKRQVIERMYD